MSNVQTNLEEDSTKQNAARQKYLESLKLYKEIRKKKGNTVQVLSGNNKGKKGEVLEVIPKADKIIVKGVNVRKKYVKISAWGRTRQSLTSSET